MNEHEIRQQIQNILNQPHKLNQWEKDFVKALQDSVNCGGIITAKVLEKLNEIELKLKEKPSIRPCEECSNGWVLYEDRFNHNELIARRCECHGGPQSLIRYLDSRNEPIAKQQAQAVLRWEEEMKNDHEGRFIKKTKEELDRQYGQEAYKQA